MSIIDGALKVVSFFKYLKPKTVKYCMFPQTVKLPSVTVTESQSENLFIGSDGAKYVARTVTCKNSVKFSDGQKYCNGETAYFKVEPVVWETGGRIYAREEVKNKRGKVVKIKRVKTKKNAFVSKYVLSVKGATLDRLLISEEEEKKLGKLSLKVIETVSDFNGCYSIGWKNTRSVRRNNVRRVTDYALACGVGTKGDKAYHTLMGNSLCIYPNGKFKTIPKKVTAGEVLKFNAEPKIFNTEN